MKLLLLSVLLLFCTFSCSSVNHILKNSATTSIQPVEFISLLPDVDFSLVAGDISDITFFTIKIKLDSLATPIITLEDEKIILSDLGQAVQDYKASMPDSISYRLKLNWEIDKNVPVAFYAKARSEMKKISQLRVMYSNFAGEKMMESYPPYKEPTNKPALNCNCCKAKRGYYLPRKKRYYDTLRDCISQSFDFVDIEVKKDAIFENGKSMSNIEIATELQLKMEKSNPVKFITLLHTDTLSTFSTYLDALVLVHRVYAKSRNTKSMKLFNKPYDKLSKSQYYRIRRDLPIIISISFD